MTAISSGNRFNASSKIIGFFQQEKLALFKKIMLSKNQYTIPLFILVIVGISILENSFLDSTPVLQTLLRISCAPSL